VLIPTFHARLRMKNSLYFLVEFCMKWHLHFANATVLSASQQPEFSVHIRSKWSIARADSNTRVLHTKNWLFEFYCDHQFINTWPPSGQQDTYNDRPPVTLRWFCSCPFSFPFVSSKDDTNLIVSNENLMSTEIPAVYSFLYQSITDSGFVHDGIEMAGKLIFMRVYSRYRMWSNDHHDCSIWYAFSFQL